MISKDLEEPILFNPARLDCLGCNRLDIITGFTDCDRIKTHIIELHDGSACNDKIYAKGIKINIILGMTSGCSLTTKKHDKICSALKRASQTGVEVKCRYICQGKDVHSKVYIWYRNDEPIIAFCGSANYSINAFQRRRECMVECDCQEAVAYYNELFPDTVDCFDPEARSVLSVSDEEQTNDEIDSQNLENLSYEYYDGIEPLDTLRVSLLKTNGEVGYGSGINWGIRPNSTKRDRNQAYIPYNKADRKEGFFPKRIHEEDKNCPLFKVITKDDAFYMRLAQERDKAIHTAESNAILGKWLRDRLGIPSGTFITKEMLEEYGATSVVFRKYKDNIYMLDFEPNA